MPLWLLLWMVGVRIALLVLMGCVHNTFPSHNAQGVIHFPLRATRAPSEGTCFSLQGTICTNCQTHCTWIDGDGAFCYERGLIFPRNRLQSMIYPFLLESLTRWDAARFLRIAHQPQIYIPKPLTDWEECEGDNQGTMFLDTYAASEPWHAFLPTYPACIRHVTIILRRIFPQNILPTTCEQLVVLSAWLIGLIASGVAAEALYQLTKQRYGTHLAQTTTLFFIFNPATVFFTSAYSESLFSCLVFMGCRMWHRQQGLARVLAALPFWVTAAACRSNGIVYMGYILLFTMGNFLVPNTVMFSKLPWIFVTTLAATAIALPLRWHDRRGVDLHCSHSPYPDWCEQANDVSFSLYHYVQRKYWNVGLFQYYQVEQIPNFLLATPVLVLATSATSVWIQNSIQRFRSSKKQIGPVTLLGYLKQTLAVSVMGNSSQDSTLFNSPLEDPAALADFAVLGAASLLCITVVHIQVSTRLLFSTCPALYWYMACLHSKPTPSLLRSRVSHMLVAYCCLYILLGGIFHSLWLPWT